MSETSASVVDAEAPAREDLLVLYDQHCEDLGLTRDTRKSRLIAARAFLHRHDDPVTWMAQPVDLRLVDLELMPGVWAFLVFLMASGRLRGDFEFLARKHAGQSFARSVAVCHKDAIVRLQKAADCLEWSDNWRNAVMNEALAFAVAYCGAAPEELRPEALDDLASRIARSPHFSPSTRRIRRSHLHSLRRLLYEAGMTDRPGVRYRGNGPGNLPSRLAVVKAPEIRQTMLSYLEARHAVLRPNSIRHLATNLACFGEFLSERFPELSSLRDLERHHVEVYLAYLPNRGWRGQFKNGDVRVSKATVHETLVALRTFLSDIQAWGWKQAPSRSVLLASDVPRLSQCLPRALPPDVDHALMVAVAQLEDRFARMSITILRGTGLRIGEVLALELDCVTNYGEQGFWLRVPLGKLDNERSVPLDGQSLAAIEEWSAGRGRQRGLPNERDGRMVDYLFVEHGYRLSSARIHKGLRAAVVAAGLTGPDGKPLRVVPHQLRHTYATSLVNAGMSLQGLMTLLGHRSPVMTMRYATLASPTLRRAYEQAIGKIRPRIPTAFSPHPRLPDKAQWLAGEMLKTRLGHGYCSRELVAEACQYANICEQCAFFMTTPEFEPALESQLADVKALREDAAERGWDSETARHDRVAKNLENHLKRMRKTS